MKTAKADPLPSVGIVTEVKGTYVTARMFENTNNLTYYRNGVTYRGVGTGEYIGIQRGPYKLVGKVLHEYLEDTQKDSNDQEFLKNRFIREVDISIIGAFRQSKFTFGISVFPQIFSEIVLLSSEESLQILTGNTLTIPFPLCIGKTVPEGLKYSLDWPHIFNTHFAIFGNTGSGKSNTLSKIYSELFNTAAKNNWAITNSKFIFIDFNGEYTGDESLTSKKKTIKLNTLSASKGDKIILPRSEFWDIEMLSVLFSATQQTQEPFLRTTLNYFNPGKSQVTKEEIISYITTAFCQVFQNNVQDPRTLNLLKVILSDLQIKLPEDSEITIWLKASWNSNSSTYFSNIYNINYSGLFSHVIKQEKIYFNNIVNKSQFRHLIEETLNQTGVMVDTDWQPLTLLSVFVHLQMIYKLTYGGAQFDFILPLLSRIEAKSKMFNKLIKVSNDDSDNLSEQYCTIISLRNVNKDAKATIPLLIARYLYKLQKKSLLGEDEITKTTNLIIDEAHNILSVNKNREGDKWRDYRLDVFEEIIKEGRKFGFFLTIASQRPADISATIVSQMHNFIIHRLVNEVDLNMLGNTLNSLDSVSKSAIPSLAPGSAIFTGTSFPLPVMVHIDQLDRSHAPSSDNANLEKLWLPHASKK
ncbi:MAG: ATP-binding protein [Liquorilactobacillus hordei]|uniref:ATP-binding protein n=1 Tax=Liquorilactobacillus hordei TaxID=468911 RepID=UPI0039EC30BE